MASNITRTDDSDLTIVGGFVPDALLPVATPVVTETIETDGEGIIKCHGDANNECVRAKSWTESAALVPVLFYKAIIDFFSLAYVFIALWMIFWHFVAIRIAQGLPHEFLAIFLSIYFAVATLFLFRAINRA